MNNIEYQFLPQEIKETPKIEKYFYPNRKNYGYHNLLNKLKDIKWGNLPWFSPITHWSEKEIDKLDKEINKRVHFLPSNCRF